MTPRDYEESFHNLTVSLDGGGTTTVDVHRYRINDKKHQSDETYGTREPVKRKDQLLGQIRLQVAQLEKAAAAKPDAEIKDRITDEATPVYALLDQGYGASEAVLMRASEVDRISMSVRRKYNAARTVHLSNAQVLRGILSKAVLMDVHTGKGSPEEIALILHLVSRYKLYDRKFEADPAAGVRDYCEQNIGLDCNGFTGGYARATGKAKVPNTQIPSYVSGTPLRTRIEDVEPTDVMVWPSYGHITIIDSLEPLSTGPDGKPARDCLVVESTPTDLMHVPQSQLGGLQHSTYSIRSVNKDNKLFLIERPKGRTRDYVYIAPLT